LVGQLRVHIGVGRQRGTNAVKVASAHRLQQTIFRWTGNSGKTTAQQQ
jgi:hypothetical protein